VRLSELVTAERVIVPLDAATPADAARELIRRLVETGAVHEPEKLRERVAEELGEDTVAMGDRAFVMHYRTDAVRELVVALGTTSEPIRRATDDVEAPGARIALVIVAPRQFAARYLQVLGAFARALANPRVVDAILAATGPSELASLHELREYELPEQLLVRDMMSTRPRTTSPDAPLRDAALQIARAGIGALPVVEADGLLVGMLSERELIRHLLTAYLQGPSARASLGAAPAAGAHRLVRDVMTRQVLCVSSEQPLAEVASIMVNKDLDGVPVVRDGRVVGFLTRGDIIRKLLGS
jgi:CBS domain-containing protein/mannitol/fructose-specific phosphotransferase system IIA component (Ntr-type)